MPRSTGFGGDAGDRVGGALDPADRGAVPARRPVGQGDRERHAAGRRRAARAAGFRAPSGNEGLTSAASVRRLGSAAGFRTRSSSPPARAPGTAAWCREFSLALGRAEPRRVTLGRHRERARERDGHLAGVGEFVQREARVPQGRWRRGAEQAVGVGRRLPRALHELVGQADAARLGAARSEGEVPLGIAVARLGAVERTARARTRGCRPARTPSRAGWRGRTRRAPRAACARAALPSGSGPRPRGTTTRRRPGSAA